MNEVLVYTFDAPPVGDDTVRRQLLGGKGASLAEMTAAGLPVPPGFTITTASCRRYLDTGWDAGIEDAVRAGIARLEAQTGKRLGDRHAPLLVSVRSGAEVSMPGMMDTVLDVGMSADVEAALTDATGDPAFAADTRRRALLSFASVVLRAPRAVVEQAGTVVEPASAETLLAEAGFNVPADPIDQILAGVRAVFESWTSSRACHYREIQGIDDSIGTAATVQAMVFGNLGDRSGTGVAFTRDPASGRPGLMGDFLPGAQGEDVVAGGHETLPLADMKTTWPTQYADLERIAGVLERTFADMVDLEFTVESGTLWMLQARRGKRSPLAAFRCAIDMANDSDFPVERAEAVRRCRPYFDHPPTVADTTGESAALHEIARGLPASPGRATGVLCTDPDEAVGLAAHGHDVILVRRTTSPSDVHGMAASVGLFTLRGGLVSHAAVVARDWGLPAAVGASDAEISVEGLRGPGGVARPGTVVTVDGDRGVLYLGGADLASRTAPEALRVMEWAEALSDEGLDAAPHPVVVDGAGDDDGDSTRFEILHALRIKGIAGIDVVSAMTGRSAADVKDQLAVMASDGFVDHVQARGGMWRLTTAGREAHAFALAEERRSIDISAIGYERFLELNSVFKQLCTDWQLRDGQPNDHGEPVYDAAIVQGLCALDDRAQVVVEELASVLWWAAPYTSRLAEARMRVAAGDAKALTGVMCNSYHDIWMELHEDLIITQGIDRAAEECT